MTIAARQFEWLGNNQDELMAWMGLHLRARNVADIPAMFLLNGDVQFPSKDGGMESAAPGDSIKIAVGDGPGDLRVCGCDWPGQLT